MGTETTRAVVRLPSNLHFQLRVALLHRGVTVQEYLTEALLEKMERDSFTFTTSIKALAEQVSGAHAEAPKLTDAERIKLTVAKYHDEHEGAPMRLRDLCRVLGVSRQLVEKSKVEAGIVITSDPHGLRQNVAPSKPAWVFTEHEYKNPRGHSVDREEDASSVSSVTALSVDPAPAATSSSPTTPSSKVAHYGGKAIRFTPIGELLKAANTKKEEE